MMAVKYTPLLLSKFNAVKDIPSLPGVYMIECLANGKKYIGASVNLRRRTHNHLSMSTMGDDSPMVKDFKTYGIESFKVTALEIVEDRSMLSERERYWFNLITADSESYNTEPPKLNRYWR